MATTLQAGDIAILGVNTDDPDKITFVALTNLDSGTVINFTDNGVTSAGVLKSNEGTWVWTATSTITAGTVISLDATTASTGTVTKSGTLALSASGDQVIAYQGSATSPSYVYALNDKGTQWQTDSTTTNDSALPTGLTNGMNAVAMIEKDNVAYIGITSGTKQELLTAISNPANWTGDDTTAPTHMTGSFTVTDNPTAPVDTTAPTLISSTPVDESGNFASNKDIVLNFDEKIKAGTGQILLKDAQGTIVETFDIASSNKITFTGNTITINPSNDLIANTRYSLEITPNAVTDLAGNAWQTNFGTTTPATLNFSTTAPSYTLIHDIQGVGNTGSANYVGKEVTINAVITAYVPNLKGFYVQEQATDYDVNASTSEGIFVYYGNANPGVTMASIGDSVTLTGLVSEYYNNTQINYKQNFAVTQDGNITNLPSPTVVTLPTADSFDWESVEGMYVNVKSATDNGSLVVTETYDLARYGEVVLTSDKVQEQYAVNHAPSVDGYTQYVKDIAKDRIIIEDANTAQNPDSLIFGRNGQPLSATNTLRGGDAVGEINGVVTYANNNYKIQPIDGQGYNFTGADRPTAQDIQTTAKGAEITVASANVLNLFTTYGEAAFTTPMGNTQTGRGADNQTEFEMQLAKVVANISGLNADVVGLMELQNNGFGDGSAIKTLVDALNAKMGAGTYDYIKGPYHDGVGTVATAGTDAIMVGMIYKPSKVTPVGDAVVPNVQEYTAFASANRVPLAQAFKSNLDGEVFTTVVNHLKSKGSLTDADLGDGQGNNPATRLEAVKQLKSWMDTDPTHSGDKDNLLIGDFNAYDMESSIQYLENNGYNLHHEAYSYVYDGLWGSLDHALSSDSLTSQITSVTTWEINAQEPGVYDYNTNFKEAGQQALTQADAYRSSDHNPLLIGLKLGADSPTIPPQNIIYGTDKMELLKGTADNDTFISSLGNDVLNGNLGIDTVDYSNQTASLNVNLASEQAIGQSFGKQRLMSIENIIGTNFDDTILGSKWDNTLQGGAGNDTLNGGLGKDTLQGGAGNDLYLFDSAFGIDSLLDTQGSDTVRFTSLTINDLNFEKIGDSLKVSEKAHNENALTINHWYQAGGAYIVENWQMADGATFGANAIVSRVL